MRTGGLMGRDLKARPVMTKMRDVRNAIAENRIPIGLDHAQLDRHDSQLGAPG
jgi:hypothetical protein